MWTAWKNLPIKFSCCLGSLRLVARTLKNRTGAVTVDDSHCLCNGFQEDRGQCVDVFGGTVLLNTRFGCAPTAIVLL